MLIPGVGLNYFITSVEHNTENELCKLRCLLMLHVSSDVFLMVSKFRRLHASHASRCSMRCLKDDATFSDVRSGCQTEHLRLLHKHVDSLPLRLKIVLNRLLTFPELIDMSVMPCMTSFLVKTEGRSTPWFGTLPILKRCLCIIVVDSRPR